MNSKTYATSGNLAVENTRPSVQSVAHCTAAGRSSKALAARTTGVGAQPAPCAQPKHTTTTTCGAVRRVAPRELLPAATENATHAGRHERERPPKDNAPHSSTQDTQLESVCCMRAAALLCRALQATQCCVDLQRPPHKSIDTRQEEYKGKNHARNPWGTNAPHARVPPRQACMLQRKEAKSQTRRACRPVGKSTF